jgi:hypothetical protein
MIAVSNLNHTFDLKTFLLLGNRKKSHDKSAVHGVMGDNDNTAAVVKAAAVGNDNNCARRGARRISLASHVW